MSCLVKAGALALAMSCVVCACSNDAPAAPARPDGGAAGREDAGSQTIVIDLDSGLALEDAGAPSDDDAGDDGDDGTCTVRIESHALLPGPHLAAPLPDDAYNSMPPSSGPHCDSWAQWATFAESRPLPACYFLHNLEHAGVALLYDCPEGCPELAAELEQIKADAAADPNCEQKRIVITPYATMDSTIAAASWGATWNSDCPVIGSAVRASLLDFIGLHLGSNGLGPEWNVCSSGSVGP